MEQAEVLAHSCDQMWELICLNNLEGTRFLGSDLGQKWLWPSWVEAASLGIDWFTSSTVHRHSIKSGGILRLIPGMLQNIKGCWLCGRKRGRCKDVPGAAFVIAVANVVLGVRVFIPESTEVRLIKGQRILVALIFGASTLNHWWSWAYGYKGREQKL